MFNHNLLKLRLHFLTSCPGFESCGENRLHPTQKSTPTLLLLPNMARLSLKLASYKDAAALNSDVDFVVKMICNFPGDQP